ncbi:unnamed protein product [Brachionus calyciflorus]|uniref:Uncharacterized protein n=1 Tax=Brachionus calyciflorus TaxID=104777 RepID=A0A813M5R7_9BILA|nr:unnamed protein product [Brachionus calyciflorus]
MFQIDNADKDIENSTEQLKLYIDDVKSMLSAISKEKNSAKLIEYSNEFKKLEQRFDKFKIDNQNDKRIENLNLLLNNQSSIIQKQKEEFDIIRKEFNELKLNNYKHEFTRLYEIFETKLQALYSIDDDPIFLLNDSIASLKHLKTFVLEYETFVQSLCKIDVSSIKNLEKNLLEIENDSKMKEEKKIVYDTLLLSIEAKKIDLDKVRQISLLKEKVLSYEKILGDLRNKLFFTE